MGVVLVNLFEAQKRTAIL